MIQSDQQTYRPDAPQPSAKGLWPLVFLAVGGLYLLTAQRGVAWQDSGIFQQRMHTFYRALTGQLGEGRVEPALTGRLGLALAHPLLIALGGLTVPLRLLTETWRFNAVCGLAGALAAANLAVLARRLTGKVPLAAWFAAGAFALAHTVWWLSTITESHALLAAIFSAELLVLLALIRRPGSGWVALLGLFNGLGVATHNLALLALPVYVAVVVVLLARRRLRWWALGIFVLAWWAGASLLLRLVIVEAGRSGWAAAIHSALFGARWQGAVLGARLRTATLGLGYVAYNFPNLALPLAAVGLWRLRRHVGAGVAAALACLLVIHFGFAVRYGVVDQFMFFVPFYLLVSLLGAIGLAGLAEKRRWLQAIALISLAVGPAVYAASGTLVKALDLPLPGAKRILPYRDHARYWLVPWKHDERSAELFARDAVRQLRLHPNRVLVIADETMRPVLDMAREEADPPLGDMDVLSAWRKDLLDLLEGDLVGFRQNALENHVTVYVTSNVPGYCPRPLLGYVEDVPTGVLYRVRLTGPPTSQPATGPSEAPGSGPAAAAP